jgi:acetolactate synthase-1/2/3 large subunit
MPRLVKSSRGSGSTLAEDGTAPAEHPLAGSTMIGADAIVQVLADEGVDTIFGYSGGAILPTYDAIFRYNEKRSLEEQIRLIVPATEQGAGFMAAGYARSSGRVGVFLVTSGPGATNSVTPVRDCQADSVPVVLICGQVPRAAMGTDAFRKRRCSTSCRPAPSMCSCSPTSTRSRRRCAARSTWRAAAVPDRW